MIRECRKSEFNTIFEIINEAAQADRGVIPQDRYGFILRKCYGRISELLGQQNGDAF